ncbi:MAG: hypothetical protein KF688_08005 [Pirellulales bacterium]|nr:hypothetical protein [Pirellulales bacterium]
MFCSVRGLVLLVLVAAAAWCGRSAPAQAGPISRNNPYRSFNISGVNYGSMQWERQNRSAVRSPASHRIWRRR